MTLHKDLTGTDLHEPKGVAAAAASTVYVSNGSGSGVWKKPGNTEIDRTGIAPLLNFSNQYTHPNINTVSNGYGITGRAGTLTNLFWIVAATVNVDTTVTLVRNGSLTVVTFVIPAGTTAGVSGNVSVSANNVFSGGNTLTFVTNGSGSGTATLSMDLFFTY